MNWIPKRTASKAFGTPSAKGYVIQTRIGGFTPRPVQEFGSSCVSFVTARRQLEMLIAWHEKQGDTVRDTGAEHDGKFLASYAIVQMQ